VTWACGWANSTEAAHRFRTLRTKALLVLVVLGVFQGYVLLALDPARLGPDDGQAEYAELHPILRMSVATVLLVDDNLLITDLSRHPRDYEAMGLPVNPQSPTLSTRRRLRPRAGPAVRRGTRWCTTC